MLKQSLIWTTLPNGVSDDGQSLRLSVLLSPRLTCDPADGTVWLHQYPDFVNWPEFLSRSTFIVHFGGASVSVKANDFSGKTRIDTQVAQADPAVWKALFPEPEKVWVAGFQFQDLSGRFVMSYNTRELHGLVRNLYAKLAKSAGDRLPKVSELLDDPQWKQVMAAIAQNDRYSLDYETGDDPQKTTKLPHPAMLLKKIRQGYSDKSPCGELLARFQLFHTPPSTPEEQRYKVDPQGPVKPGDPRANPKVTWRTHKRMELPQPADFAKKIDFHQIIAAMNQYPTLLRKLGLVTDILINKNAFTASLQEKLWVEVVLPTGSHGVTHTPAASPRTQTKLSASTFAPVSRPDADALPGDYRVSDGLLRLNKDQWDLLQADVDGAGHKLMNFARTLAGMTQNHKFIQAKTKQLDPTSRKEKETGVPALRNAGLMLLHTDRAKMLENAFLRNKQINQPVENIHGQISTPPPLLWAEDLVRGWRIDIWDDKTGQWRSLCQREAVYDLHQGDVTVRVPLEEGTVRLAATKSPDPASNQDVIYLHEALLSWTGWSLCAPPPGRTIDKDDKPADAAADVPPGLHLKTDFKAAKGSLPRLRYGRKYWIRARMTDLAGNSLRPQTNDFGPEAPQTNARSYLRFEPMMPPALALIRPKGAQNPEAPAEGESMDHLAIRTFNETYNDPAPSGQKARRVVVPMRTTLREAEQHGMLDSQGKLDAQAYNMLVNKDAALPEAVITVTGPLTGPAGASATYAVFDEAGPLPYLPDPLASVIAARIFNLTKWDDTEIIKIPFYPHGRWPDALPFQIVISEASGVPTYDEATHTLSIPLPKAERATLRLSVMPGDQKTLDLMGVWSWLSDAEKIAQGKRAQTGQHWMLTPWREIGLVHAVQKPLLRPAFKAFGIDRDFASTAARPWFRAEVSLKSTDHIDLLAEWHEPKDDPAVAAGSDVTRTDHAFSVKITDPESYAGKSDHQLVADFDDLIDVARFKKHEFSDTRYRRIEYWMNATTRFREYLTPDILLTKDKNGNFIQDAKGNYIPDDSRIKVTGDRIVDWIPNSAPPPAPEVLYVIPTFGWTRLASGKTKKTWRRGGGLRVYLNRPWYVSGYGEMLAVVLPPAGFTQDPNDKPAAQPLKSFVSQWGNDPIWKSPFVPGVAPRRTDFPLQRLKPDPSGKWLPKFAADTKEFDQKPGDFQTTNLKPPALTAPNTSVEVAPHDVFYDEERRLWYCDIEIEAGASYYPFIRLALARYQPVSIMGAHLSDVVMADFMQLAPDRWLNVTQTADRRSHRVAVFGNTYSDSSGSQEARLSQSSVVSGPPGLKPHAEQPASVAKKSVIEIWVEKLNQAEGDDFGWERVSDAIVKQDSLIVKPVDGNLKPERKIDKTLLAQRNKRARDLRKAHDYTALLNENLIEPEFLQPVLWEGVVSLAPKASLDVPYRLVIAEYDEYLIDDQTPYSPTPSKKDRRLVFVEHVRI